MTIYISPSQLLGPLCPRCLWMRYRNVETSRGGFEQFNMHDELQKRALKKGVALNALGIPGKVHAHSGWVESRDFGAGTSHYIAVRGKFDILTELDEGGFAPVDLKTAKAKAEKAETYRRQLSSYALSMLEPFDGRVIDVRRAFVLPWWAEPDNGSFIPEVTPPTLMVQMHGYGIEVLYDIEETRRGVEEIASIVTRKFIPSPGGDCKTCNFVRDYGEMVRVNRQPKALSPEPVGVG